MEYKKKPAKKKRREKSIPPSESWPDMRSQLCETNDTWDRGNRIAGVDYKR